MSNEERYEAIAAYVNMRIANAQFRKETISAMDIQNAFRDRIGSVDEIQTTMHAVAKSYYLREDILGNILLG